MRFWSKKRDFWGTEIYLYTYSRMFCTTRREVDGEYLLLVHSLSRIREVTSMYDPLSFKRTVRIRATYLIFHNALQFPTSIPFTSILCLEFDDLGRPSRSVLSTFPSIIERHTEFIFPYEYWSCHLESRLWCLSDLQGAPGCVTA